jgi:hypothetical protein
LPTQVEKLLLLIAPLFQQLIILVITSLWTIFSYSIYVT